MKFSEAWLREWVSPTLAQGELCDRLTMTGLEVESIAPVAGHFARVVVGMITRVERHPAADQLHLCEVSIGPARSLTVVCGATNVRVGLKVPVALENAVLPKEVVVKAASIRGVPSAGMLCSALELGLAEESESLFELPADAPLGHDLWEYLQLSDHILEVAVTPNRGDCLSLQGMAREVAAVTRTRLKKRAILPVKPQFSDLFPVSVTAREACPRYVGRVIRGVKADAATPIWLRERLRRSGLRSLSPIVDVTNYVMLELGQPMHAFDLAQLEQGIVVRMARPGESLTLLDGREIQLNKDTLIIADQKKPLAIAGVMGGLDSGIRSSTQDLFLESAFFTPAVVASQRQAHQLNSESSYRFERGVDPQLQVQALERATRLLLDIVGGTPGPIQEEQTEEGFAPRRLCLRRERIRSVLGCSTITDQEVKALLQGLGFQCQKEKNQWQVQVPSWRFDVSQEIDLIEELARLRW